MRNRNNRYVITFLEKRYLWYVYDTLNDTCVGDFVSKKRAEKFVKELNEKESTI